MFWFTNLEEISLFFIIAEPVLKDHRIDHLNDHTTEVFQGKWSIFGNRLNNIEI